MNNIVKYMVIIATKLDMLAIAKVGDEVKINFQQLSRTMTKFMHHLKIWKKVNTATVRVKLHPKPND